MRSRRHLQRLILAALALATAGSSLRAQARLVAIHEIQGGGSRSPYEGQLVTTAGVITGRRSNGIYIQSPEGAQDGDPRTSEGLFVFTGSAPAPAWSPGTVVTVTGRVLEFVPAADPSSPPLTELAESPAVSVRGAGASLPAPVEIQPADLHPEAGDSRLEALEGMRVRVGSLTMVSGTLGSVTESTATASSNGVFYGVLPGMARPARLPGLPGDAPLPAGAPCCVPRAPRAASMLRVDSDALTGAAALNLPAGTEIGPVVGPLDYAFRTYTLLPDPLLPPPVLQQAAATTLRRPDDDEVAMATINLERFFDSTDDPGVADAVLTPAAYANRLAKASLHIRRLLHLPHVIGVQEVENVATLRALADRLNRDAREARELKPRYEAYVDEGNDPGGIDVGFLVDRARMEVLQVVQEGRSEQFRNPAGQLELTHDRPPLVLRARPILPAGITRALTVMVVHMRSLIDIDSPAAGPRVRAKRAAQAESLARLVDARQAAGESIIVMGDMNASAFSDGYVDVVGTVRGLPVPRDQVVTPTRDLVDPDLQLPAVAEGERYSYVLDGVSEALDHILLSQDLVGAVSGFGYARGNADAPAVWRNDVARPERLSDHDGARVLLRLR